MICLVLSIFNLELGTHGNESGYYCRLLVVTMLISEFSFHSYVMLFELLLFLYRVANHVRDFLDLWMCS